MSAPDFSAFGVVLDPAPDLDGWFHGPFVDDPEQAKDLAAQIRASQMAKDYGVLVGMRGEDSGHRIYLTPPLGARELVENFGVGGGGGEPLIARTAERLACIERICPLVVTFADHKGLHAEFIRRLDEAAALRIEALWTLDDDDGDVEGLEGYISEWSGKGPIIAPHLVEEQALRLWWD